MKWEYTCQYLWKNVSDTESRNTALLNKFGLKDWELVTVDNGTAYFKRPVEKCPECQGFGKFLITFGEFETCKACGGSGYKR